MRIIAGELRRRQIASPPSSSPARPMPDRVREALFNLLRGHTEGQCVVDVFAGSGAVGLEAVSRGALRCVFIERDRPTARVLRQNIQSLDVEDRCTVVEADALGPTALARVPRQIHLLFFDPPYELLQDRRRRRLAMAQFARFGQLLDETGYAALRTPWPFVDRIEPAEEGARPVVRDAPLEVEGLVGPETHEYGSTALHLYMKAPNSDKPIELA